MPIRVVVSKSFVIQDLDMNGFVVRMGLSLFLLCYSLRFSFLFGIWLVKD